MPTNGFVEIIKAVGHEPLGFYSLVFLILGSLCYRVIGKLAKPTSKEVAVILAIILLGFSGVAVAVVRANNKLSTQKEAELKPPNYTALLKLIGDRSSVQPAVISFRNSSGQLNFGCGETKTTTVSWNAPAGAQEINASPSWEVFDGQKSKDAHIDYVGTTATATGSITGKDRDWFGNCPGGGHGELVITGTYRILQPSPGKPFESLQSGAVSMGKPYVAPLPEEKDLMLSALEVTIIPGGGNPVVLKLTPLPNAGSTETIQKQNGPFSVTLSGKVVTIALEK